MRFEKIIPTARLQPYIRHFVISENEAESNYKVFPSTGLVIGFQYGGRLSEIRQQKKNSLAASGITGISDGVKLFHNSRNTSSILVFFTETGFAHFSAHPAHELFNQSLSLENLFSRDRIREAEDRLMRCSTDKQRISVIEKFLLVHLKAIEDDQLVVEAVRLIYASKGAVRIKDLNRQLCISASPFEKRFRKLVGTSPKKFASIVRFNTVLDALGSAKSLTEICYEHNFFDQAHFIKDFRQYTGDTPEQFKQKA